MSTDPTAEHIDAVARVIDPVAFTYGHPRWDACREVARLASAAVLTSTDPAVLAALAASLPAEVMLAALRLSQDVLDFGELTRDESLTRDALLLQAFDRLPPIDGEAQR